MCVWVLILCAPSAPLESPPAEFGKRGFQYSAEYFTENTGFVNPAVSHADIRCSTYSIPKLRADFSAFWLG